MNSDFFLKQVDIVDFYEWLQHQRAETLTENCNLSFPFQLHKTDVADGITCCFAFTFSCFSCNTACTELTYWLQ